MLARGTSKGAAAREIGDADAADRSRIAWPFGLIGEARSKDRGFDRVSSVWPTYDGAVRLFDLSNSGVDTTTDARSLEKRSA